jgi:hypothetical protein
MVLSVDTLPIMEVEHIEMNDLAKRICRTSHFAVKF